LRQALAAAGLGGVEAEAGLDVLSARQEREWYPDHRADDGGRQGEKVRAAAAKANSLRRLLDALERAEDQGQGDQPGSWSATATALRSAYRPPWELALQRWFDAQAAGLRSFVRPSRRNAGASDLVLPGRKREGWALHVVLDTSGSMVDALPEVLGMMAGFCENAGAWAVHILQCDTEVTVDEWVEPADLASYPIRGFGGSDMTPALQRLAEDPQVASALVLTDGDIDYPPEPVPYAVLWGVLAADGHSWFQPPYGQVIPIPPQRYSPYLVPDRM
jgi:predicted metal-dependent peptidase